LEEQHEARIKGNIPHLNEEIELATSVCKMQTFEQFIAKGQVAQVDGKRNWNQLSLFKLLTGRS
jgi:hypothetical protein